MHSVALMVYPNFQSLSLSLGSVFEGANLLRGEPAYEFQPGVGKWRRGDDPPGVLGEHHADPTRG